MVFVGIWGFRPPTDLLTPYKINGKMKFKQAQNYEHDRFKFSNKFSLPEICKMADRVADSWFSSPLMVKAGFVYGDRVQNKLEYHQVWHLYSSEN